MTDRLIYIDPNFPQLMMRETLFHEMAHAYMDTINRRDLKGLTPEQIEGVCDLFATSMLDRDLQV